MAAYCWVYDYVLSASETGRSSRASTVLELWAYLYRYLLTRLVKQKPKLVVVTAATGCGSVENPWIFTW